MHIARVYSTERPSEEMFRKRFGGSPSRSRVRGVIKKETVLNPPYRLQNPERFKFLSRRVSVYIELSTARSRHSVEITRSGVMCSAVREKPINISLFKNGSGGARSQDVFTYTLLFFAIFSRKDYTRNFAISTCSHRRKISIRATRRRENFKANF